jgi:hypothetical protein
MNVGSFGFTPEMLDRLRQSGGLNSTANANASYQVDLGQVPDGTSADYAGQDWNKFMADWGPLIEKQMASLTDNSMVDRAAKDAERTPGQIAGAVDRNIARRGGVQGDQRMAIDASRQLYNPLQAANTMNNARIDQRTRNFDTALKLSGMGSDVYQMGLDNIRESEGLAAQRRMNNAQAKATNKQNLVSGGITLATAAAMAFL